MVTLKTLAQATGQEVFDQVATHLLTQMKRSAYLDGCLYRSPDGLKCAAGCLIAEDEYDPEMEGHGWVYLVDRFGFTQSHESLIQQLQDVHDTYQPQDWLEQLKRTAFEFSLELHPRSTSIPVTP